MSSTFWYGNAAKSRIIGELLSDAAGRAVTVLDYGAGDGGAWPQILARHGNLTLTLFEPHAPSAGAARERLAGRQATVVPDLQAIPAEAFDYAVSFSVLEHVLDRDAYVRNLHRWMRRGGTVWLNYDDGHFRNTLALDAPLATHKGPLSEFLRNRLAPLWPRVGREHLYQARVERAAADALVAGAGFRVLGEFYSNLESLKHLSKSIPDSRQEQFMQLWLDTERRLEEFSAHGAEQRGDANILWNCMPSRTLVLRKA